MSTWRARLSAQWADVLDAIPIPGLERFEFRDSFATAWKSFNHYQYKYTCLGLRRHGLHSAGRGWRYC
jgi:hypothetical protein